ncbi:MAG: TIGR00341 family protein [Flavobacteriales bacterium]
MNFLFRYFSLQRDQEDHEKVLENVSANITFRGHNLWILACAVIIASIGLNVNSTAVVIGAMLISPLMGPIVGAGFSLATFDFILLKQSAKNLILATAVGLFFSAFYFVLSPFKEEQSEIVARTFPTIYDVIIAFSGGIVGAIAITRKEKGNPIPGVAIATALMPPLCAAGYGLAVANWKFLFGALFLYIINCVFIALATISIVKLLKFPHAKWVEEKQAKNIRLGITVLTVAIVIPSIYFAYMLYSEKKTNQRIDQFVKTEFTDNGYVVVYNQLEKESSGNRLVIALLNKNYSDEELKNLEDKFHRTAAPDVDLDIKQDNDLEELMKNQSKENSDLLEKDLRIKELEKELESKKIDSKQLGKELSVFQPKVTKLSVSYHDISNPGEEEHFVPVALYNVSDTIGVNEGAISNWLKTRIACDSVIVARMR